MLGKDVGGKSKRRDVLSQRKGENRKGSVTRQAQVKHLRRDEGRGGSEQPPQSQGPEEV